MTFFSKESIVCTNQLTKIFNKHILIGKSRPAVNKLSLNIQSGEIFALLGPNGSGKSTLIKLLLGILKPTSGSALILGKKPGSFSIKEYIGYLPEVNQIYPFLTAKETLNLFAKIYSIPQKTRKHQINKLLNILELESYKNRLVEQYSKGMLRRLGLAVSLINQPKLLFLDEPSDGLDPIAMRKFKNLLLELKNTGTTIFLSSHLLSEVAEVADSLALMYKGNILCQGKLTDLLFESDKTIIETTATAEVVESIAQKIKDISPESMINIMHPRKNLEQFFISEIENAKKQKV